MSTQPDSTPKTTAEAPGKGVVCDALVSPSYFARAGIPACSMWGKTEIEELALAYVTAMARDGDTWHPITDTRAAELLTHDEHRSLIVRLPLGDYPRYRAWWDMIAAQLKDAAGAFEVGGLAWNRWRYDRANETDQQRRAPGNQP